MTVRQHARLRELLAPAWELVPSGGVVEALREVKDALELARIRAAAELADEALRGVLEQGLAGRTERDVATELELGDAHGWAPRGRAFLRSSPRGSIRRCPTPSRARW